MLRLTPSASAPRRALLAVLALVLALAGCDTTFEVDLPREPPRLVVNALFAPDSLLTLVVGQSAPALDGATSDRVTTATVRLFEDGAFVGEAVYSPNRLRYVSEVRPREGRTYRVEVSAPGFPPVSAENTVPLAPGSFEIVSVVRGEEPSLGRDRFDTVTIRFSDPPGDDAYALYGLVERTFAGGSTPQLFPLLFESADPVLADGFLGELLSESDFVSYLRAYFQSTPFDGETVEVRLQVRRTEDPPGESQVTERLRLARLSRTYYDYARAYEAARRGGLLGDVTQLPSNVEGGYGIFAAFAPAEMVVPTPAR